MLSHITDLNYGTYIQLLQAYTSQIVVMAMLALAIGGDTISNQARREAIIDGLYDLPSEFLSAEYLIVILYMLRNSLFLPK